MVSRRVPTGVPAGDSTAPSGTWGAAVAPSLESFSAKEYGELTKVIGGLRRELKEKNVQIEEGKKLLFEKDIKIKEQEDLLLEQENNMKGQQDMILSQQSLIQNQQNMISKIQMMNIK